MQAIGGGIAFIKSSRSIDDSMDMDDNPDTTLLAYVNGDHEYALFNPHGTEMNERKVRPTDRVSGLEGTGMTMSKDRFYVGLCTNMTI